MSADLLALLDQLDALHAAGTADGEWRLQDNGTRHGPEYRYEILDDEGSVAVCSDDNDATDTTGADRTALIVAAVNAAPKLTAALRAALELADELEREAGERKRRAERTPGSAPFAADRIRLFAGARHQRLAADQLRAAITDALTPEQVPS